jgi:hypothetical protein
MSVPSISLNSPTIKTLWRQRLLLLLVISAFMAPLVAAWLLIGHWRPHGSVQHGELLNPARPIALQFTTLDQQGSTHNEAWRGRWVLIYLGSAALCDPRCRTSLYDMRQVRLALGRDLERVKTALLLDATPGAELRQWLSAEHPATVVVTVDSVNQQLLMAAFPQAGQLGDWMYLLDPLGNLVIRYPIDMDPRGLLKDLQRLLKWSKIG